MKNQDRGSAILLLAALSLLGAVDWVGAGAGAAPSSRELAIDPNPSLCFLELDFHGDIGTYRYSFLGDGRVNFDRYANGGDAKPFERWRAQLSAEELETLLSDLIDSGLYAFDPEAQLERERTAGIRRFSVADGGWSEVGVSLVRRTSARTGPGEVVARHFSLGAELTLSPSVLGKFRADLPVIPELDAYRRIVALSEVLRRRATEILPPPEPGDLSFAADGEAVLVLMSKGNELPTAARLTLWPSGRAEVSSSSRGSGEVVLSIAERTRILDLIADGGLLEYDEKQVAKVRARAVKRPLEGIGADAESSTVEVEFRVVRERSAGLVPEPRSGKIVLRNPTGSAAEYPDIREYRAVAALEELLADAVSRAEFPKR